MKNVIQKNFSQALEGLLQKGISLGLGITIFASVVSVGVASVAMLETNPAKTELNLRAKRIFAQDEAHRQSFGRKFSPEELYKLSIALKFGDLDQARVSLQKLEKQQ